MTANFLFTFCNDPDSESSMARDSQGEASKIYQQYKQKMVAENDNQDDDAERTTHMVKIGVTDENGKPMETYHHNCVHTRV